MECYYFICLAALRVHIVDAEESMRNYVYRKGVALNRGKPDKKANIKL